MKTETEVLQDKLWNAYDRYQSARGYWDGNMRDDEMSYELYSLYLDAFNLNLGHTPFYL